MTGKTIGRNINTIDSMTTTTISLNSSTATLLSGRNLDRNFFSVTLDDTNQSTAIVYLRYYKASDDNTKHGAYILIKHVAGNDSLYDGYHYMNHDNIYTGEVSAITESGNLDVTITEG